MGRDSVLPIHLSAPALDSYGKASSLPRPRASYLEIHNNVSERDLWAAAKTAADSIATWATTAKITVGVLHPTGCLGPASPNGGGSLAMLVRYKAETLMELLSTSIRFRQGPTPRTSSEHITLRLRLACFQRSCLFPCFHNTVDVLLVTCGSPFTLIGPLATLARLSRRGAQGHRFVYLDPSPQPMTIPLFSRKLF